MTSLDEAKDAVLKAIVELAAEAKDYSGNTRAEMVRDAAIAYRAIRGGAQPGSSVVEK